MQRALERRTLRCRSRRLIRGCGNRTEAWAEHPPSRSGASCARRWVLDVRFQSAVALTCTGITLIHHGTYDSITIRLE